MATDNKSHVLAAASRSRVSAPEEEVYGLLGALLGTLEVVATDDLDPLTSAQAERVRSAVRLCHGLQHQVEALLTLVADDLRSQLRRHHVPVRPLVEHAVRGALRSLPSRAVELSVPEGEWGQARVYVDPSRVDRMLKALAEVLAASLGRAGSVRVSVQATEAHVALTLTGRMGTPMTGKQLGAEPTLASSELLLRGAQRLFELSGGGFSVDAAALELCIRLPVSETP